MSVTLEGKKGNYSFDPFSEETKIGEGGMGLVYLGKHVQTGNNVAIKVLFKELSSNPINIERALKESSINIDHKNIIKMIEFVEKDGIYHIISEYLNGQSLDKYIEGQKDITKEKAIFIVNEVLAGLSVLHHSKPPIVHRDIKPSNIFLCDSGEVKIMDFGVARSLEGGSKRLTKTGSVVGTPYYAAPEQIRSQTELINPTTDIYSLGVTLYELLSGTVPFEGKSEYDTLKMQVEEPLPPHPKIPKRLFEVITKATSKNQKDRFKSAEDFSKSLIPFMRKLPSTKTTTSNKKGSLSISRILNFILFPVAALFGVLFFSMKSELDKTRRYYDDTQYYFMTENNSLKNALDQSITSFPFAVESISIRAKEYEGNTVLYDYPDKLWGNQRMTLQPRISFRSFLRLPSSQTIYYKIYDPSDKLIYRVDWKSHPVSTNVKYTNKNNIEIAASDELLSFEFSGIRQYFSSGTYRIEFWKDDKCLGGRNFVLN